LFTGRLAGTAISSGPTGNQPNGTKSLSGSKGSFRYNVRPPQTDVDVVMPIVWPSGASRARAPREIVPPAPGRFSTTTGTPSFWLRNSPYTRA
jgi:hypothetical protein